MKIGLKGWPGNDAHQFNALTFPSGGVTYFFIPNPYKDDGSLFFPTEVMQAVGTLLPYGHVRPDAHC